MNSRFTIGFATVLALVALRLGLGCHFFYEGVWKHVHADEFSAEPFLTLAKGPFAPVFYAMIPDLDGRQRLVVVPLKDKDGKEVKDSDGHTLETVDTSKLRARWEEIRGAFVARYAPRGGDAAEKEAERLEKESKAALEQHLAMIDGFFLDHIDDIKGYLGSLERFYDNPERNQTAPFQQERRWKEQSKLRAEVKGWFTQLELREKGFVSALMDLRNDAEAAKGAMPKEWNPLRWTRIQQINFAVTYGLAAIGLCLILGFFTRFAALGGAAFMCFVIATQPAWPTLYPPDPAVVGHALLINKDFVELLSLLVIASSPVGRWGGLDFILNRLFWRPKFGIGAERD